MEEKISLLRKQVIEKMEKVKSATDVENIRVEYLGKKGEVIEILKNLKNVEASKRKEIGEKANKLRVEIEELIETKKQSLKKKSTKKKLKMRKR